MVPKSGTSHRSWHSPQHPSSLAPLEYETPSPTHFGTFEILALSIIMNPCTDNAHDILQCFLHPALIIITNKSQILN